MIRKNAWKSYTDSQKQELNTINEKYKACLNAGKTERECVKLAVKMLEEKAREMGSTTKYSSTEASEALSYMAL